MTVPDSNSKNTMLWTMFIRTPLMSIYVRMTWSDLFNLDVKLYKGSFEPRQNYIRIYDCSTVFQVACQSILSTMNTRHNNKDASQDEPQNYSNSFGSRQDEDEWLRQHGASGFSGFSGSDSQKEVCSECFLPGAPSTNAVAFSLRVVTPLRRV